MAILYLHIVAYSFLDKVQITPFKYSGSPNDPLNDVLVQFTP
jgi:hypothetical protein